MAKKVYPIKRKNRFSCDAFHISESLLFETIPSFLQSLIGRRSRLRCNIADMYQEAIVVSSSDDLRITWVGHATFLIQVNGVSVLTDPIFGDVTWLFKRTIPVGIALDQLPPIDYIILSHNHRDHMDASSLHTIRARNPQVKVLVPLGDKMWFDNASFVNAQEFTWWQSYHDERIRCTFLPAYHWSQRQLFDKNRSLWGSWMIQVGDQVIYFAGDSSYGDHFTQIRQEFPAIDVALLPIGPCEPKKWMARTHLFAQTAGNAFLDLHARYFIPMHWGTFPFGTNHIMQPLKELLAWWQQSQGQLSDKFLYALRAGEHVVFYR